MKIFEYKDFKENQLFNAIQQSFYDKLSGFGHKHYGDNFNEKGFQKNLNAILNQLFLIKNKKISVLQFKQNFLELKKKSIIGSVNLILDDGNECKFEHYDVDFIHYSNLMFQLFYRYFSKELEYKDEYFERIVKFITNNYHELNNNPLNFNINIVTKMTFDNLSFTSKDIADFIDLMLDGLKQHYAFELEVAEEDIPAMDDEELKTLGLKIMFLKELGILDFLREEYNLKNKNFKLSKVIHSFTGFGEKKINAIIHPIYSEYSGQKNNPYGNDKNLPKVKGIFESLMLNK